MTADRDEDALLHVAEAVASGTAVDWRSAEATTPDAESRRTLEQLKIVAHLAAACRAPVSAPPDRTLWGRLEIRRELGRGSFATVYLAWDPALEREIALKVLHDEQRTAAVIQEARLLARVRHPNVVTVHGVDEFEGAVGLRMEYVDGLTLKQTLSSRGALGADEAALIGLDLCRAVAAVHKAGLLHRDIKVHNIMREAGGRIVLMDFGAGAVRATDGDANRSAGTPLYLAPEVIEGHPTTIASDIYSLGVLLFHLVTLRYPVPGDTFEDVVDAHKRRARLALADLRPDLPTAFVRLVETALHQDPARRFRSIGAMQQELASALDFASRTDERQRIVAAPTRPPCIAVVPFVNLGPDQDIEYLCDGLAEELMIALGKIRGLRVASRSASRQLQTTTDLRALCGELDVNVVLEGTVRKSGDRLRITAQLVSGEDGCHIWSEGYNRELADVLGVQEGIAQNVVDKLQITLADVQAARLTRRHTDNPDAYLGYLKGRFYWSRRYKVGLKTALKEFETALAEDAGYALAHAGVADVYTMMGFYSLDLPRKMFAAASNAVEQALALDPNLAEAHSSLALVQLGRDWDFPAAEASLRRAIELDPTLPLAHMYLAWVRVLRGDPAGGLVEARRGQQIEPLSPLVNAGVGFTFYLSRRYEEAIVELQKSLEIDPDFLLAIHFIAMCRAQQSRIAEAIELSERTVALSRRAPFYLGLLGHFTARAGDRARVDALLAELDDLGKTGTYVPPHCQAYIFAGLNDLDRAMEWEAKAFDDGASPFNYFSPVIDNLQRDPRHALELQRMGLKL
jgi:TolB-like protein/Tfp pilus assembly protein PilF/predicted Ser/Thr protein kinase